MMTDFARCHAYLTQELAEVQRSISDSKRRLLELLAREQELNQAIRDAHRNKTNRSDVY